MMDAEPAETKQQTKPGTEEIPCFRCGETFTRSTRGRNPYVIRCQPCRTIQYRENRNKTRARVRAGIVDPYWRQERPTTLLDFDACRDKKESGLTLLEDRMPRHYLSPAGPEHGRSTYDVSLRNYLDVLSQKAATDKWWSLNPYWHEGL